MTGIKYIENALELVRDIIKNNLDAKLTTIESEYTTLADPITLQRPASTSYSIHELREVWPLPYIQVIPKTTNCLIPGKRFEENDHHMTVIVHAYSPEGKEELCAKRCYRYARAVDEILIENRTLGDKVIDVITESVDYSPMMSDGNGLKMEVYHNVLVKIVEDIA